MTTAKTYAQLRRLSDLAAIRCAIAGRERGRAAGSVGLMDVADMCRRRATTVAVRDWHAERDALLMIACEWDLRRDRLDDQSDACLAAIAVFLRAA